MAPAARPREGASCDIAIIGAGVNGAGIARDAALRGLSVVVLDQGDVCSGTSAWSSRLIHGGLRYLEYGELGLVFESLRERITLRRIAPHLVEPIRIRIPIYAGARRGPWLIRLGMILYDLLSIGKTVSRHEMLDRDEALAADPGLNAEGLDAMAAYFDGQVTFAERLVLENLLAARAAGAGIRTYSRVSGIDVEDGAVTGLEITDTLSGRRERLATGLVVNAAGPWVDAVLDVAPGSAEGLIGGTKGSHIVVGPFRGAPTDAFYVEAEADGRPFFIIPWNRQYLIGTTDIRYDGEPGAVRATRAEVDYLLRETNRVFPGADLAPGDIHYAYAGVRPLPRRDEGPAGAITRRHIIRENREVARGLVSIIGGKLTTYRNLAEQTVDLAGRLLDRRLPACRTAELPLPGASGLAEARRELENLGTLSAGGIARLLAIYGGRSRRIARLAAAEPGLDAALDDGKTVLAAEVVFSIREELARTLTDLVHRRLMVGLDPDQGRPLYGAVADLAAGEFGWDEATRRQALGELVAYSDSFRGEY